MAAGAVACGVCCVLPFALPAVALASAGGVVAWLGRLQVWSLLLAVAVVAVAWILIIVQSVSTKTKPSRSTLYMMGIATTVLIVALLWSRIEPFVIQALKA